MKKENEFELIFEQNDLINYDQMYAVKGGAPDGCQDWNVGINFIITACTNVCIGKAQYPTAQ